MSKLTSDNLTALTALSALTAFCGDKDHPFVKNSEVFYDMKAKAPLSRKPSFSSSYTESCAQETEETEETEEAEELCKMSDKSPKTPNSEDPEMKPQTSLALSDHILPGDGDIAKMCRFMTPEQLKSWLDNATTAKKTDYFKGPRGYKGVRNPVNTSMTAVLLPRGQKSIEPSEKQKLATQIIGETIKREMPELAYHVYLLLIHYMKNDSTIRQYFNTNDKSSPIKVVMNGGYAQMLIFGEENLPAYGDMDISVLISPDLDIETGRMLREKMKSIIESVLALHKRAIDDIFFLKGNKLDNVPIKLAVTNEKRDAFIDRLSNKLAEVGLIAPFDNFKQAATTHSVFMREHKDPEIAKDYVVRIATSNVESLPTCPLNRTPCPMSSNDAIGSYEEKIAESMFFCARLGLNVLEEQLRPCNSVDLKIEATDDEEVRVKLSQSMKSQLHPFKVSFIDITMPDVMSAYLNDMWHNMTFQVKSDPVVDKYYSARADQALAEGRPGRYFRSLRILTATPLTLIYEQERILDVYDGNPCKKEKRRQRIEAMRSLGAEMAAWTA